MSRVSWRKDKIALPVEKRSQDHNFSGKYFVVDNPKSDNSNKNTSILVINKVTKTDLGYYECNVKNEIGSENDTIELTFAPETPHLKEFSIDGDTLVTHWIIRSYQPLEEISLLYLENGVK